MQSRLVQHLTRPAKIALSGAAALALVAGFVASRPLRRLAAREPLEINLDHGLADCPWPSGVDRLDPKGRVSVEDRVVVLRTDARVYYTGRVVALTCFSAYDVGPEITLALPSGEPSEGDDFAPPPLDPKLDRTRDDLAAALAAYRRARHVVDDFALSTETTERDRQALDAWYGGDHSRVGGASLDYVGTLASGKVEVELFRGADVVLSFGFWTDPPRASWDGAQPRRICIHSPVEGGPAWVQPPPHTDAEIARSPFKMCPASRWGH